jgi:hypothetical protein
MKVILRECGAIMRTWYMRMALKLLGKREWIILQLEATTSYINRVCVSFSILLNTIFGGKSNQTLSATQYERKRKGLWNVCWLIDKLFFWDPDHCENAWVKWKIIHGAINHYECIGENFLKKTQKNG